jgi:hypothetical protein
VEERGKINEKPKDPGATIKKVKIDNRWKSRIFLDATKNLVVVKMEDQGDQIDHILVYLLGDLLMYSGQLCCSLQK